MTIFVVVIASSTLSTPIAFAASWENSEAHPKMVELVSDMTGSVAATRIRGIAAVARTNADNWGLAQKQGCGLRWPRQGALRPAAYFSLLHKDVVRTLRTQVRARWIKGYSSAEPDQLQYRLWNHYGDGLPLSANEFRHKDKLLEAVVGLPAERFCQERTFRTEVMRYLNELPRKDREQLTEPARTKGDCFTHSLVDDNFGVLYTDFGSALGVVTSFTEPMGREHRSEALRVEIFPYTEAFSKGAPTTWATELVEVHPTASGQERIKALHVSGDEMMAADFHEPTTTVPSMDSGPELTMDEYRGKPDWNNYGCFRSHAYQHRKNHFQLAEVQNWARKELLLPEPSHYEQ